MARIEVHGMAPHEPVAEFHLKQNGPFGSLNSRAGAAGSHERLEPAAAFRADQCIRGCTEQGKGKLGRSACTLALAQASRSGDSALILASIVHLISPGFMDRAACCYLTALMQEMHHPRRGAMAWGPCSFPACVSSA